MTLLLFALVMLVVIDIMLKYKPQGMIFYKNAHIFSVVVAVTEYTENIEELAEFARNSRHEFVFVSVNYAIDPTDYQGIKVIEMQEAFDEHATMVKTPMILKAYHAGYPYTNESFVLFMHADVKLINHKTMNHMANNLVEHQLYTIKEILPFKDHKQGYKLFFDVYRDVSLPDEKINPSFYAIKRETYELTGVHKQPLTSLLTLEQLVAKKNVNVVHVKHDQSLFKEEYPYPFKTYMTRFFDWFKTTEDFTGFRRMLLLLFAFHIFYVFLIIDLNWYNIILFVIAQFSAYIAIRRYARHHWLQYILMPFYMLFFDGVLLVACCKRFFYQKALKKQLNPHQAVDTISVNDSDKVKVIKDDVIKTNDQELTGQKTAEKPPATNEETKPSHQAVKQTGQQPDLKPEAKAPKAPTNDKPVKKAAESAPSQPKTTKKASEGKQDG